MKSNKQANEPYIHIVSEKYSHLPISIDFTISDLKYLELKYDNLIISLGEWTFTTNPFFSE